MLIYQNFLTILENIVRIRMNNNPIIFFFLVENSILIEKKTLHLSEINVEIVIMKYFLSCKCFLPIFHFILLLSKIYKYCTIIFNITLNSKILFYPIE